MIRQPEFTQKSWIKRLKLLFACAFILFASYVCATAEKAPLHHSITWMHIIGWIGLVFFGICTLAILYRELRFRGGAQAAIADEGLYIVGECVPWSVVTEIKIWKMNNQRLGLMVMTTNCEERIAAAPWWKRWNMKYNYKHYGAIYLIANETFNGSCEAFIDACAPYINKKKH